MPWDVSDVDRHKQGLSPKKKRQWVHIANTALASCLKAGGSQESCEGKAIRMASGVVRKGGVMDKTEALALTIEAQIAKSDDAQQRIWGWASIAVMKDGTPLVDLQGDAIAIADLAEAWYAYVAESGELNFAHQGPVRGQLIEAMVFTPEKLEALGLAPDSLPQGAWVGYHLPDAADYQLMKAQGFFMFSIEGTGVREPY